MASDDPTKGSSGFFAEYGRTLRATGPAGRRFLLGAAVYLIRTLGFSVAFPLFAKARGYSPTDIGLFIAASQFSLFLFGIPITVLGGRGHARRSLALAQLVSAAGVLALLLLPDHATGATLVAALLAGTGGAGFWVLGDPLLAATTPLAERTRVFAIKFFLLTAGIVLGGGLGGWIPGALEAAGVAERRALAVTMLAFAVCDLVQTGIFASIPAYEERPIAPALPPRVRWSSRVRGAGLPWSVMFALSVPEVGMALGHNGIRPFLSLFFTDGHGLSSAVTGTVLAALGLVASAGTLAAPRFASRFGAIPAIALLRAAGAVAVVLCFARLGFPAIFGLLCLYYFMVDGTEALVIAEAMNRIPAASRTVFSGIYAMAWSIAATGASLLSGFVQDRQHGAFGLAFGLSACGYLLSVVWLLTVFRRLPLIHHPEPATSLPLAYVEPA